ncbi:MAG: hypothetical protein Q4B13_05240 [Lautropia sp.]|nr:hypothetical protein [Lautropia sp.]
MKYLLLVTTVSGLLALSQSALAHDTMAPADTHAAITAHQTPPAQTTHASLAVHLVQVESADTAVNQPHDPMPDDGTMPSVAYGLLGLFLMICVLVKRRNDSHII